MGEFLGAAPSHELDGWITWRCAVTWSGWVNSLALRPYMDWMGEFLGAAPSHERDGWIPWRCALKRTNFISLGVQISMKHWWNDYWRVKIEWSERNFPQCHLFAYNPTPTDLGLNPGSVMRHRGLMPELWHGPCPEVWVGSRSFGVTTIRCFLGVPYHVRTERFPRYRLLPVEWSELLIPQVLPSPPIPETGCLDSCFLDVHSLSWQVKG
jgi:hypothetical protein